MSRYPWDRTDTAIAVLVIGLTAAIGLMLVTGFRDPTSRPAAVESAAPVVARPVAHLGAWGVTEEGRRWGIVALPRTWHKGDTILLLTDNAKMERKP
jgi:hypothetical protein